MTDTQSDRLSTPTETPAASGWEQRLRTRMPASRVRRAWMVWALWGMLGTALTLEGTEGLEGLRGLTVAGWLTAPFWAAFAVWPFAYAWRSYADRRLLSEGTEVIVHDPAGERPLSANALRLRRGYLAALPALLEAFPGAKSFIEALPAHEANPEAGIPVATVEPAVLAEAGRAYLDAHPEALDNPEDDVANLALWADTLERTDRAVRG